VHDLTPKVAIRNADGSEVASLQATRVEGDRADFTTNSAPLVDEALAQMRSQRGTDSVSFQVDAEASRMSQLRVAKVTKDAQEITVLAKAKPASATTYGEALSASVGLTAWLAWPPVRPTASVNALWMQALSSARFSHLKIMTPSADDAPPIFLTEVNTLHGPGRLWGASVDPTRGIKSKKLKDYRLTDLLPADVYKGSKLTAISERVAIDTGITDLFGTVIAEGNLVPDWSGLLRGRYFVNRWVPAGTVATAYATSATMQYFGSATGTTGSATFTRSLLPELPSINANLISVSVELLNGSTLDGESEVTLD
jgi:hypothetical protein